MSEELPAGWATARVSDLVDFGPKNIADDDVEAGFVPLRHLGVHFRDQHAYEPKTWGTIKKAYTHFADGDVLLARITPSFENGKAGIARNLPNGIGAGSSEYFVCRTFPESLVPEYLLAHFKTERFLRDGEQVMSGAVGQQRVPKQYVLDSEIPLPPLDEQKRIVDKLDTLLACVDACRERLDRVSAVLKRFRQSVLAAATSGELTADWREERRIASDWPISNVESVALVGTGATPLRSNGSFFATSGTPWVTSAATGLPVVNESREFVTPAAIATHRLKTFPIGTLLVAMYGEGKTRGQVTELGIAATINQACAAIVVDEARAVRRFVRLVLEANYLAMRDLAEGGNQPNLNLTKIKRLPIPLPALAEQHEIVRRVDALLAYVGRVETTCGAARAHVDRLTPALLAKAFRGELVPQDPDDEPASLLLRRMPQLREQQKPDTSGSGGKKMTKSSSRRVARNRRSLVEVLREQGKPLTPESLFDLAGFDEDTVDEFFEQLRGMIEEGVIRERRLSRKDVTLDTAP